MKQYLTPEQTAKLIELGFEKPSNTVVKEEPIYREGSIIDWKIVGEEGSYSIGELIEMLNSQDKLTLTKLEHKWFVNYHTKNVELIDALYEMVVKLKEEGVICGKQ